MITPKRLHAVEFHDLSVTPQAVRETIVETLGRGLRWGRFYEAIAPTFASFCERSGATRILDLCSGSGEPAATLLDALQKRDLLRPRFTLSDLLPNHDLLNTAAARHSTHIDVVAQSVDATAVPADLDHGARTVFNAFHHFQPKLASAILADTVRSRRSIFIVEAFPRNPLGIVPMLPVLGLAMAATPFAPGPRRILKSLLLPLSTPIGLWDGVVSTLRIHSEAELREMTRAAVDYDWRFEVVAYPLGGRATVFSGVPR